jgi:hypothetical protein
MTDRRASHLSYRAEGSDSYQDRRSTDRLLHLVICLSLFYLPLKKPRVLLLASETSAVAKKLA